MDAAAQQGREQAILAHMPLVKQIAASIFNLRSFDGVPFEEYVQFGAEGLMQAYDRFDPEQGVRFETYARHRIRGAIINGLERSTEVNQQVSTLRKMAQERIDSLLAAGEPEEEHNGSDALARLVDISLGLAIAYMLEDTALFCPDHSLQHWDDGANNLSYKQLQQKLHDAFSCLTDSEQGVIDQHYFQHQSFDWIAQHLSLSKSRIAQLHRQAIRKMRTQISISHFNELIG